MCRVLTNLGACRHPKHLHFHVNSGDEQTAPRTRRTKSSPV